MKPISSVSFLVIDTAWFVHESRADKLLTQKILSRHFCWLFMLFVLSPSILAQEIQFNPTVNITENHQTKTLHLTGTSKRSALFFKIYSIAHYTADYQMFSGDESTIFSEIINTNTTKQIAMVFSRDIKANKIREKLASGVKENCVADEFSLVKSDLDLFKQVINQDVKKNDEFVIRWLTDGNLLMFYNGKFVTQIQSPLLAKLLWSIWFGEDAVVSRSELAKQLLQSSPRS